MRLQLTRALSSAELRSHDTLPELAHRAFRLRVVDAYMIADLRLAVEQPGRVAQSLGSYGLCGREGVRKFIWLARWAASAVFRALYGVPIRRRNAPRSESRPRRRLFCDEGTFPFQPQQVVRNRCEWCICSRMRSRTRRIRRGSSGLPDPVHLDFAGIAMILYPIGCAPGYWRCDYPSLRFIISRSNDRSQYFTLPNSGTARSWWYGSRL